MTVGNSASFFVNLFLPIFFFQQLFNYLLCFLRNYLGFQNNYEDTVMFSISFQFRGEPCRETSNRVTSIEISGGHMGAQKRTLIQV